jgi:nucleoside-diphosphate-sugar epimerase
MSPYYNEKSVLLIGATGKTGLAILEQLTKHPSKPSVHVLCRDATKLAQNYQDQCASILKGNARNASDIEMALVQTQADWVIVCVGNGESVAKNDIRTANANATVRVLKQPQFQHVRALVVSSIGAGSSRVIVGMGIGKLISYHLKHVLADHTGQEAAFSQIQKRATIVRATSLTDGQPTGKLAYFEDKSKCPSIKTDRADLAEWVAEEVCGNNNKSRVVNVTSVKQ